jgi:protein subunit release factor B
LITCVEDEGIQFELYLDWYRKSLEPWTYSVEVFRGREQKVNEVDSGARVTCIETGQVAECSKHRSYYQNLEEAKRMLNGQD